jgi:type I restriction enzyme M protein
VGLPDRPRPIDNHAGFIWSVADLLRGDYKQSEYGKVILPLTVLRRLDCVLEPTKAAVLDRAKSLRGRVENVERVLELVAGQRFYNTSSLDFRGLLSDPNQIAGNLRGYIAAFSPAGREVLEKFEFDQQISRLERSDLLYLVLSRFAEIDLHPDVVSNVEMGYLYEELVRRFSELSNETAGEHFTPREVIRLMVNLLFAEDDDALTGAGAVRTLFDPACGTGGMLSVAEEYLREHNASARLEVFGQELNDETYAICRSDMMLKGLDPSRIARGNSFTEDGHQGRTFDYLLANPPFGVEWKKVEQAIRAEHEAHGFSGRFGAGLPRINDGSLLFLQHMIAKMKPVAEGGSRLAIVFNGSPLFSGAAGSGESEIRRWIIENDWLEAVVALPDQLFYNTGITTYVSILTNRKRRERRGTVQLVDARASWVKMRKSLGAKRKAMSSDQIADITRLYADFTQSEGVKILPNEAFGYQRITLERPLRTRWRITDETVRRVAETRQWAELTDTERTNVAAVLGRLAGTSTIDRRVLADQLRGVPAKLDKALWKLVAVTDPNAPALLNRQGQPAPDPDLRDHESVPLPAGAVTWAPDPSERLESLEYRSAIANYVASEVLPFVSEAWVDHTKTKLGYEIPLTRHFYRYVPPRPLAEIDAEIKALEAEIARINLVADGVAGNRSGRGVEAATLPWVRTRGVGWREVRLALVARLGSGHTPSRDHPEWWTHGTIPWITTGEVAQMRSDRIEVITETREKISALGLANSAAELCPAGTVVLCRTASAGYSAIMGTEMATSQDFATWTCGPLLNPRFLLLCLRAMRQDLLGRLAMGSTHKTIYMPDLQALRIPLPPLDQQNAIVTEVCRRVARIDRTADAINRQLSLLVERRRALVSAAVAGDLRVPELAG